MSDDLEDALLAAVPDPPAPPPEPVRAPAFMRSWLVQLRDGRVLRVDADACRATNGILEFWLSTLADDFGGSLIAAFEYGDWKRVARMDRETGENAAWVVLKEKEARRK